MKIKSPEISSTPVTVAFKVQGRVVAIHLKDQVLFLQNENQKIEIKFLNQRDLTEVQTGDIIEAELQTELTPVLIHLRILTPNRTSRKTQHWLNHTLNPRRIRAMKIRMQVEAGIREFFTSQGFLETHTPLLVSCPGMEPHIRPLSVQPVRGPETENGNEGEIKDHEPLSYLPTSPEFAMKKLLVGGLEKIFQMTSAFRHEPKSKTHHPEFMMLEWYRAYSDYEAVMRDTEQLFEFLALKILGKPTLLFNGREISVKAPWPRLRVRDLFLQRVGIDLVLASTLPLLSQECERLRIKVNAGETWDDLYFKIWLDFIEPHLPSDQAVFVTRYPASQAALAVVDQDPDGSSWARRFEVYAGGVELGNAFEELTDPHEQRARFIKDMELREQLYGKSFPKSPLDEEFLEALMEGMPPSGGIAMGVDRIAMLYANETDIDYTIWL